MTDGAKTREVAPGVVQVFLPLPFKPTIVNVYLVRAGATWTLVDTGMHTGDSKATFAAALAEHGIAPRDVTKIVCTHHHIDHYGTSGPYRELTHAQVLLHPGHDADHHDQRGDADGHAPQGDPGDERKQTAPLARGQVALEARQLLGLRRAGEH